MHKVVPIRNEEAAATFEALRVGVPQLDGDAAVLRTLLAAELGPRGDTVAASAFDVLRRHLHDTDVFVVVDVPARRETAP